MLDSRRCGCALEQRVADALGEVERGLHAQVLARLDIDVPAMPAADWPPGVYGFGGDVLRVG